MGKRILIVDDSRTMREMVAFTLRQSGYEVQEAEDGAKAMSAFRSGRFDIVITDLNMPVMDGITLIRSLRAEPAGRGLPILMLTTVSDAAVKEQGKAAGATGWLVKPFAPDKLIDVVRKVSP